jgi:arylsulfatase A-like enzyme
VDPTLGTNAWQQRIERSGQAVAPEAVTGVTALYDAEVAESDAAFGELVDELRRRGLLDETVIVVAADHGEELFDHGGFGHGTTLRAEVLDIPLMIRFPHGRSAGRVEAVVEQVDLMPTVLEIFGMTPPAPVQGRSLLPLCGARPPAGWKNRAISHLRRGGRVSVGLLDPSWKLILAEDDGRLVPALFDRRADRRERHDLAAEDWGRVERLRSKLQRALDREPGGLEGRPSPVELDPEREEQLRALGYL